MNGELAPALCLSRSSPISSGRPPSLARFRRGKELGMLGRQLHKFFIVSEILGKESQPLLRTDALTNSVKFLNRRRASKIIDFLLISRSEIIPWLTNRLK